MASPLLQTWLPLLVVVWAAALTRGLPEPVSRKALCREGRQHPPPPTTAGQQSHSGPVQGGAVEATWDVAGEAIWQGFAKAVGSNGATGKSPSKPGSTRGQLLEPRSRPPTPSRPCRMHQPSPSPLSQLHGEGLARAGDKIRLMEAKAKGKVGASTNPTLPRVMKKVPSMTNPPVGKTWQLIREESMTSQSFEELSKLALRPLDLDMTSHSRHRWPTKQPGKPSRPWYLAHPIAEGAKEVGSRHQKS